MAKRKRRRKSREPELVRRDGALAAVFVNTATARRKSLVTYADLLAWGKENDALEAADAERLEHAAADNPAAAAAVEARAPELRALVERILLALASLRMPAAADLEAFNAELGRVLAARRLAAGAGGFDWTWRDGDHGDDLDRMLWPVVLSTAEILASGDHLYVRQCAAKDCELLFVDRTPGRHRRWCSKKGCGNRTWAREHYHREVKPRRLQRKQRDLQPEEPSD